ncbi:MAG: InlB B-repeat-containing protein [Clostridiales bacterium]|nr:InlB B-repeat-containing protein [Clostridiales bacterium]
MTKRLLKTMILPLTVVATALAFIACDGNNPPDVKYKVTYVIGENADGVAPTETDKAVGEKFIIKSADGITCDGATFTGWSDGSVIYQAGAEYTMPSKAVTFTAQWEPNGTPATFSVTYDLNGGTGETPTVSYKGATEKFNLATADGFSYEGKEFDGWSDGTNKYAAGAEYTMSGTPVVFTAQWKDVDDGTDKYTVTLVKASNSSLEPSVEGELPVIGKKAEGEKFTLPADTFTLAHYTLSTWRVQKYVIPEVGEPYWDTVQSYQPNQEIEMPAFNIRIAAVWAANEVTISFDANGGTGDAMTAVKQNFGTTMALETSQKFACTYTAPTGKKFAGWATTPNGTALDNGTKLDGTIVGANDTVTLYALWVTDEEPANPITALVGKWSNGTDTLIISAKKVNEYMQGSAIVNGTLCNVFIYDGAVSITSLDYNLYYDVDFTETSITLIDEDEQEKVFTTKTAVTDSAVSEFVGKWAITGTNQPWVITEDKVYYGTALSEANMVIIGDYCALYYEIGYSTYVYVMQKDGDTLTGYMGATAVTFNAGTYSLLTVNGVLNQVVNSGAAPDASKINAPTAPEGKEFAGWVLAGTETSFDVTAVMTADTSITATFSDIVVSGNAKTYSGQVQAGLQKKVLTVTIDFDTLECTIVFGSNSPESCVLELKTEGYFFSENTTLCDDEPLWIKVIDDNTIEVWDDYNGPYNKKATLTLQA